MKNYRWVVWSEDPAAKGTLFGQTDDAGVDPAQAYADFQFEVAIPANYTVTFNMGGHGTTIATQIVESGKTATKPTDPTESGWTFGGWYADSTLNVAFDFTKAIIVNTTVYAKWTENTPAAEFSYDAVSGADGTWTKNSGKDYTLTIKRSVNDETCYSHFDSVEIDGKALTAGTDYDSKAGSTVITLKASALQKLSDGKHTVTVNFDDGKVTTNLTVKAASGNGGQDASPKTGDNSHTGLWIALMFTSLIGLGGVTVFGRKRKESR